jgi:hypothetical protein
MSTTFEDGDDRYTDDRPSREDRNRDARLSAIYTTRQLCEQVLRQNDELEYADVLEVIEILRYLGADL